MPQRRSQRAAFRPSGAGAQRLSQLTKGANLNSFLNKIISRTNKAQEAGQEKLGNIAGMSKLARMASYFAGPWAPLANLAIGGYESIATNKAYNKLIKDVGENPGGGFLSETYAQLPEDLKTAKKRAMTGNILKTLLTTGVSASQQGSLFPGGGKTESIVPFASAEAKQLSTQGFPPYASGLGAASAAYNPYTDMSWSDYGATRMNDLERVGYGNPKVGFNPNTINDLKFLGAKANKFFQPQSRGLGNTPFDTGGFTNYLKMLNQFDTKEY